MAIKKISIEQFLELATENHVIDVRSPGEYTYAHIPGAYSLPLFSDEERKIVGTAYKQESRQKAIKLGLDFFGVKMRTMVEFADNLFQTNSNEQKDLSRKKLLVHCWRGGMRSAGVAWLLDLYGFDVYTLDGGYKSYRHWVLEQFEKEYKVRILGGYTGSGKTEILHSLKDHKCHVLDLEGLACHKGSAFGGIGQPTQPKQEMFENLLATSLASLAIKEGEHIWIEDESQRIGVINIPMPFWKLMRRKPVYFVEIPFEERLEYIIKHYGSLDREKTMNSIARIQKRLGGLETKNAIGFLLENNYKECFRILLSYYDKAYVKSLHNRENIAALLNKLDCSSVNISSITEKLLTCTAIKYQS